nr:hypothetical protein GCM10010200_002440 [Actinomadura rugatobispora]
MRRLGADEVLDYAAPGFPATIGDLDLVIDGVSAASMAALHPAIKPGGLASSLFDPHPAPPAQIRAQVVGTVAAARAPATTSPGPRRTGGRPATDGSRHRDLAAGRGADLCDADGGMRCSAHCQESGW